jgi:Leucine-rich repeat (LRR) protein
MFSILDLDDDSLLHIFSFLSIDELIQAEEVCDEFKVICENVYSSKRFHKVRQELINFKTERFRDIMDRVGHSIRAFEFSGGYIMDIYIYKALMRTLVEVISRSCSQIKSLSINYVTLKSEFYQELQSCFDKLTTLDLSHCSISEATLGFTLDGERLTSIRKLKLAGNSCMTGAFFANMKSIEVLDVSYCFNLSYFEFLKFLANCENLRELNISACCQLISEDENFLEILFSYQPRIERLEMNNTGISRADNEDTLSQFKHLKYSSFEGRKFGT